MWIQPSPGEAGWFSCLAKWQLDIASLGESLGSTWCLALRVSVEKVNAKEGKPADTCYLFGNGENELPVHFPFIYHWRATVHGVTGVRPDLATKQQQQQITALGQPHPTLVKYKLKRNAQKENFIQFSLMTQTTLKLKLYHTFIESLLYAKHGATS